MKGHFKILIAEDQVLQAIELRDLLIEEGYRVVGVATRGHQVLSLALTHKPDLVIMDIRLSNRQTAKDGIDIALDLQKMIDIAVIYHTHLRSDKEWLTRASKTRQGYFLKKPLNPNQLLTTVELALIKKTKLQEELLLHRNNNDYLANAHKQKPIKIFLGYHKKDKTYKDAFAGYLQLLSFLNKDIEYWDESKMLPGVDWKKELEQRLKVATVVIIFISMDYLISATADNEAGLNAIINKVFSSQEKVIPVLIRLVPIKALKDAGLYRFKFVNDLDMPLNALKEYEVDQVWVKIYELIEEIIDRS